MLPRLLGSISLRSLTPPWIERSAPWLTIAPSDSRPAASRALLAASADASSRAAMRSFLPGWLATSRPMSSPTRAGLPCESTVTTRMAGCWRLRPSTAPWTPSGTRSSPAPTLPTLIARSGWLPHARAPDRPSAPPRIPPAPRRRHAGLVREFGERDGVLSFRRVGRGQPDARRGREQREQRGCESKPPAPSRGRRRRDSREQGRGRLANAFDADEVAREADGLRHGHAEEEGRPAGPIPLGGHEIGAHGLEDVDVGNRDQSVVDDERLLRILTGDHLDGPRVGADGHER